MKPNAPTTFSIPAPNFTKLPNVLIDEWLPYLSEVETKVLLVIMRKTFGWHKIRDRISLSQLEKFTGAHKQAIIRATKSLIAKGILIKFIEGKKGEQQTFYELVIDDSNNSYQCDHHTPPSVIITPTKETLPKETLYIFNAHARAKDIETSEEEHQKLLASHGPEKTQKFYNRLSEWKQDTPKSKWKKNDYRSILRWVVKAEAKDEAEAQKEKSLSTPQEIQWKKKNVLAAREAQSQLRAAQSPKHKEIYITDVEVVRLDTGERIRLSCESSEFERQFLRIFNLTKNEE